MYIIKVHTLQSVYNSCSKSKLLIRTGSIHKRYVAVKMSELPNTTVYAQLFFFFFQFYLCINRNNPLQLPLSFTPLIEWLVCGCSWICSSLVQLKHWKSIASVSGLLDLHSVKLWEVQHGLTIIVSNSATMCLKKIKRFRVI